MTFVGAVTDTGQVRIRCSIADVPVLIDNNGGLTDPVSESAASIAFGRFRLVPHRRELLADGQPLKLGGRAFDVLMALIEARGAVLSKDALMARVWPNRVVEENNLQSQISALRTAFGAERELIRTISGRGYQFTGEVRIPAAAPDGRGSADLAASEREAVLPPTNLPELVSELIGRDQELHEIVDLAARRRLVTLTGAGGIGKTRLALAVARQLLPQFADGVWLAELAPLADAGLVPSAVASAVGLELSGGAASPDRVVDALNGKELLLVLDNCEHVVGAAAIMAEVLLRTSPAVRVIATSREPLKAEGEWVYPVPPLAVPAEAVEDAGDPLAYGAVRLFLHRTRAAEPHFAPDRRLAMLAAICRRLDGIPLAIELAAARAATLGIDELAARLDDRFGLLTAGRRTALPRHQTLRATLDWSYELLADSERVVLRRLAVFAGAFTLEAAGAVVSSPEISPSAVVDHLANLIAKSLVAAEVDTTIARYRLLDTMRAYALDRLAESGEREQMSRRHAEYFRDLLEQAETETQLHPTGEWLAEYLWRTDNLRAALDWAFSPTGDVSIAVPLVAAAVPLWMNLSLMVECHDRVEQALAALKAAAPDPRHEMKLHAAFGASFEYNRGPSLSEFGAAWARTLEIAESLGDSEYQLRSLRSLWVFHSAGRSHRVALAYAQRFYALAASQSDTNDRLIGERMIGTSQHLLGDQFSAGNSIERVVANYTTSDSRSQVIRFQLDPLLTARVSLARILWLQGFPDKARSTADSSIKQALTTSHPISLCFSLAHAACPIALLADDLTGAQQFAEMLLDCSQKHGLAVWRAWGQCYQAVLVTKRGDVATGLELLRSGIYELGEARLAFGHVMFLGILAATLGDVGRPAEGLDVIEDAIKQSEHTEERWLFAELLRIKGELLLLQGAPGAAATSEDHFRQAFDWAHRQGALSWELRAATSLARLLRVQGRSADAKVFLQRVYDRFIEGFDTADINAASALLRAL
ncbi:MAG TPA: winged helix-turn-helix domain-containing protein [Rhodopila sp.]|nr:winged helix-turn-helix domain-containing protein [Rhodopila sp.]